MEKRPVLKLQKTQTDRLLDQVSSLVLLTLLLLTALTYTQMPQIVPVHFNGSGEPDGYGNKAFVLMLPAIAILIYLAISVLNNYPHIFNYPIAITAANAEQQYRFATRLLRLLKLAILVIFTILLLFTYFSARNMGTASGKWLLPTLLAILAIPVSYALSRLMKKKP